MIIIIIMIITSSKPSTSPRQTSSSTPPPDIILLSTSFRFHRLAPSLVKRFFLPYQQTYPSRIPEHRYPDVQATIANRVSTFTHPSRYAPLDPAGSSQLCSSLIRPNPHLPTYRGISRTKTPAVIRKQKMYPRRTTPYEVEAYKARWAMYARLGQGHAPGAVRGPHYNGRGTRSASRGGTAAASGPHSISEGQAQLPQGGRGRGQVGFYLRKAGGKFHLPYLPFSSPSPFRGDHLILSSRQPEGPPTRNSAAAALWSTSPPTNAIIPCICKRKRYSQAHND
ncbi:hypothetical protein BDP55DRAFT_232265 [Colletotrichum godetiae]|uniref:Uncharacterized protein n=1 Tax=Colletotrichum godetiae TaxID=1209918 RepID=A0AAJ0AJY6_9PEZI|nr:uncharacterized protein BDP55DRAFT_232265 [Colletotrichum godetiae]KAK1673096.1 hypothetical protein BDP55DRAFT_232265 [Colletotrichum godetiae]